MVATHRPELGDVAMQHCCEYDKIRVDGTGLKSCSQLWNICIERCPTEIVIICNERARPRPRHVESIIDYLDKGFGMVGIYRFGFFGFRKDIIRKVGWFDERFVGGNCEDNDMIVRLGEVNIAYYEAHACGYVNVPSTWEHDRAIAHWRTKWRLTDRGYERTMGERNPPHDLGPSEGFTNWLPWDQSILIETLPGHVDRSRVGPLT